MKKIFLLIALVTATIAHAQPICPLDGSPIKPKEIRDLSAWARMPILEDGRLKPFDTYARNLLLRFSGKTTFNRRPAVEWVSRMLFAPQYTQDDKIFLINHPSIAESLAIPVEKKRRYSYKTLEPTLDQLTQLATAAGQIPDKERDVVEAELLRVYENLRLYTQLSQTFQFVFPNTDFTIESPAVAEKLGLGEGPMSFLDVALSAQAIRDATEGLERRPPDSWTNEQREIMVILSNLFQWSINYRNLPLHMIPSGKEGVWMSPWDAIAEAFQEEGVRRESNYLRNIVVSYWNGEPVQFNLNTKLFSDSLKSRMSKDERKRLGRFPLEIAYNRIQPFFISKLLYALAFILYLCSFLTASPAVYRAAWVSIILGVVPHVMAIIVRCMIMQRPPVTSLYETFIFVSFVVVILGILIERIHRRWLGLVVAAIGGTALLMIAAKYSAEGDTMQMLIAVLNSNFWLGTHVITITAGYGATCVAGLIGHIYLLQAIFKPKETKLLVSTYRIMLGMLGLSLTLTFLGTNLGGIWADQSWGRFWGWDPKENGALMIVIWTALLFHAKIAGIVKEIGMAAGAVFGMIVVMWAWFGVNLLSIGLHSYGFTSGIAWSLGIYFACEMAFIGITLFVIKNNANNGRDRSLQDHL